MTAHPFSTSCDCAACQRRLVAAFTELRDALTELSLALHDMQFECDLSRRKRCEKEVEKLILSVSTNRSFRTSQGPFGHAD